jgi:hypothetical protein
MAEKEVGEVSIYFSNINVAAVRILGSLSVGDKIHIVGHTTDFEQEVLSMHIENTPIAKAKKGQHVGIKVIARVRPKDKVYIVK